MKNVDGLTGWWFQSIWQILVKLESSPNRGEKKKYVKPPPRQGPIQFWWIFLTLLRPIIQPTSTEALQLDVGQVLLEIQGLTGGHEFWWWKTHQAIWKNMRFLVVPNWRSWNPKDQGQNEKNIWVVSPPSWLVVEPTHLKKISQNGSFLQGSG